MPPSSFMPEALSAWIFHRQPVDWRVPCIPDNATPSFRTYHYQSFVA